MYNEKRILVIAGSDSSGGAGLEADQKVIAAHGCYGMTATAALTAQNTLGVADIHVVPSEFVEKQINAVIDDVGVDIVKTGMLAAASTVKVVAEALKAHKIPFSVVDPVMVATSGAKLLPDDAMQALIDDLLPVADLLTPNIPEAKLILWKAGHDPGQVNSAEDLKRLAQALTTLGPRHVLVKGGHSPMSKATLAVISDAEQQESKDMVIANVLYSTATQTHQVFTSPHLCSRNTHGTGCSLASAIASNILNQLPSLPPTRSSIDAILPNAIATSLQYLTHSIATSLPLGSGSGPINHLSIQRSLPFVPGHFIPYILSRASIAPSWQRFTHHPFTAQLADGSLPLGSFRRYMAQDYLYLRHYARAHGLAAYKATTLAQSAASAAIVLHIQRETALHVAECAALGMAAAELEHGDDEDVATLAYSRFLLDTGASGDWFGLQVALLPCLLGYGVVAARLDAEDRAREGGREGLRKETETETETEDETKAGVDAALAHAAYARWIANYVAEDYTEAVRVGSELVEEHAARQSPARIEELVAIFRKTTDMEVAFWDMALRGDRGP